MKSIHAFSALLPGHGTSLSFDSKRGHALSPMKTNDRRSFGVKGSVSRNGSKIAAIANLLAVALFQRRAVAGRRRD
jgi:hypothetical protein